MAGLFLPKSTAFDIIYLGFQNRDLTLLSKKAQILNRVATFTAPSQSPINDKKNQNNNDRTNEPNNLVTYNDIIDQH